ncbi:MAG: pitrilysin family protein [Planctomycetota bacterium]
MILPDVHEVRLDNGFRALLVERPNLPVVASTLWYRVGARDERTGETGVSHFLEHMMFKGTERYAKGEIDLLTAKLGGSNNAFTSCDVTAYYFALAADRWETALEIEASRMTGCLLDPEEFAAEKQVVLEELAMGEDDPWNVLYHALESQLYSVHPYHHPVIGWREDLERLTVDGMRGYYQRHYGPNRAFLVAVGNLDVARSERRIKQLFGKMPASAEARAPVLGEPPPRGERRVVVRFPVQGDIARLAMCALTCRMGEPDDFTLDVVSQILGGSKNSRLYRRLVMEEQVATSVWTGNEVRLEPGLFCVAAELREGIATAQAEAIVHEEFDRLATEGPTAEELRRARTQLRAAYLFEEETVLDVALRVGRFEATTDQGYPLLGEVFDRYQQVRAKHVKDVARRFFTSDRWCTAVLLPEQKRRNGR